MLNNQDMAMLQYAIETGILDPDDVRRKMMKKENQKYLSTDIFRKGNRTIWTIEKKESSLP